MWLRDVRPDDREMIRNWRNMPEVARYMYTEGHISKEDHDKWFREAMADESRRYWIITCFGRDVGLVNLINIDRTNCRCDWAYYIADEGMRGKGIGAIVEYQVLETVFREMDLEKLCCEVLSFNEAVVKGHESFGFAREGCLRRHIRKPDGFHDVVSLGILKEEWEQKREDVRRRISRLEERIRREQARRQGD